MIDRLRKVIYSLRKRLQNVVDKAVVMSSHVTIQDVAKAAGVSIGTVSRVLNERSGVKEKTRNVVREAMKSLNYQPDQSARQLSFRKSTRVGLHVGVGRRLTPFYMLFLEALIAELSFDGYRLEEIPSRSDGLPDYLTDGLILFGARDDDPRIPYLQDRDIPFVLIGHQEGSRWVAPDDFTGGLIAAQHLLRLGHTQIAHITGNTQGQGEFDRYQGYREALSRADIEFQPELVFDGELSALGAYRAVRKHREQGAQFSAVFAATDEMALGVLAALTDLGLSVPADVSVVGFDNLPGIDMNLTTVHQDISLIAQKAVLLLKEALRDEPIRHEIVPVQLIVRGTTAGRR